MNEELREKLILELLLKDEDDINNTNDSHIIGKICMIRTYSAGVHFGKVIKKNGMEVTLEKSYRVWSWRGASALNQLSMEGSSERDECKIEMPVSFNTMKAIEIIPMSKAAIENLSGGKLWTK